MKLDSLAAHLLLPFLSAPIYAIAGYVSWLVCMTIGNELAGR